MIEPTRQWKHRLLGKAGRRRIPAVWLVTDTETRTWHDRRGDLQRFVLGWVCEWIVDRDGRTTGKAWSSFLDERAYCRHLHDRGVHYGQVMLAGHNIFFDLQACGFFEYFRRWGWKLEFYYEKGLVYILKVTRGAAEVTICSSTNWYDVSVEKLGKMVGLPKMSVDFKRATTARLLSYCRRDVEIVVLALERYVRFVVDRDLGSVALTRASQAFTAYRHRFMDHPIYLHDDQNIHDLERAAYLGGRVECFQIGECQGGPFVSLDVNSMFPWVMSKFEYPYKLVDWQCNVRPDNYLPILDRFAVVAQVELQTDEPLYGLRYKKKIVFPVGRFVTYLCSEGLRRALRAGHVVKIIQAAVYQKADLFSSFVREVYSWRNDYRKVKDEVGERLVKYLLNSSYGKFAERGVVSEIADNDSDYRYYREEDLDLVAGGVVMRTYLMNRVVTTYQQGEGRHSFTAISAHITENARLALWDIMTGIGRERVLYCDTDSVKIRQADLKYVRWPQHATRLGALKVEETSQTLVIGGCKNYRTDAGRKIKGIPARAVEVSPGVFEFDSFGRQIAHLTDQVIVGNRVTQARRVLRSRYNKGVVLAGGRVQPFRLPDASELPLF